MTDIHAEYVERAALEFARRRFPAPPGFEERDFWHALIIATEARGGIATRLLMAITALDRDLAHTHAVVECESCSWQGPLAEAMGDEALSCPNCHIDESALIVRRASDAEGDRDPS